MELAFQRTSIDVNSFSFTNLLQVLCQEFVVSFFVAIFSTFSKTHHRFGMHVLVDRLTIGIVE